MFRLVLSFPLVVLFFGITNGSTNDPDCSGGSGEDCSDCRDLQPIKRTACQVYRNQPLVVAIATSVQENLDLDSVCFTFFPMENCTGFLAYQGTVYCNGSSLITSYITTQDSVGIFTSAMPSCTYTDTVFAVAGCDECDIDMLYRCYKCGECPRSGRGIGYDPIIGLSSVAAPVGDACLRTFKEITRANGIPDQDYFALPMKYPTQCVTSPGCV